MITYGFCHPTLTVDQTDKLIFLIDLKLKRLKDESLRSKKMGGLPFEGSLLSGEEWADKVEQEITYLEQIVEELMAGKRK